MIKKGPKRCPKGWIDFRGGGLGGALDAPICFWTQKVSPKCSKNVLQGAKVTRKCFKSNPQGRKMHSYRSAKVVQVHQKYHIQNRLHMTSFWLHFGTVFCQQSQFWVKKRAPKNDSKKGDPLVANKSLWTSQETPGGRHTIKNCSSKKQLFEHMLKQLFEFLCENVDWAEN